MTKTQMKDAARRYCLATGQPPDEMQTNSRKGKSITRPAWWWELDRVKRSHAMLIAICEAMENGRG